MLAYIIHDSRRTDRDPWVAEAMARIPGLEVLEALKPGPGEKTQVGCSLSHQAIVREAMSWEYPCDPPPVMALEDDIQFTKYWNLEAFIAGALKCPCDVAAAGASGGTGGTPANGNWVIVDSFSGTHCMIYKPKAWPTILSFTPKVHIDTALSMSPLITAVHVPFMAIQYSGHSDVRGGKVNDEPAFWATEKSLDYRRNKLKNSDPARFAPRQVT